MYAPESVKQPVLIIYPTPMQPNCPSKPTSPSPIRRALELDRYMQQLLQHQAEQLAGQPGWPAKPSCVYEQLLQQIEEDLQG
ncbi:hypothetical protein HMJ29_16035 [Hymenobacter taeanensis]|uniref:Uncharacterized protein n=1 Tax=Hymenobacter taeanensis TaxID=2735321 RepID=A0A6M6BK58_9BACT|nr:MULTISPECIES: hypothetical protein [Hymenobacter]QJX48349.1 hypothetical protein HMJ29_16035 [Hymenobacter taeanensis]UOQ82159.1 hypothetical protein MUN83_05130 [Hymenobacter sp. 5414T-23]